MQPADPTSRRPELEPHDTSTSTATTLQHENLTPLLLHTASSARWRRRRNNLSNSNSDNPILRHRANSELVLRVSVMEEVHGVDVSWLHHANKDKDKDRQQHKQHKHTQSSPDVHRPVQPPTSTPNRQLPNPPNVTPPTPVEPSKDSTNAFSATPPSANKNQPKRPSLLRGSSAERTSQDASGGKKRSSWMNSISSKFSSSAPSTPSDRPGPTPQQQLARQISNQSTQTPSPGSNGGGEVAEEAEPYTPSKPRESSSSFFSSITRRLSSASQNGGIPKAYGAGSVCPRRVLNVDPNRERCAVPEMDPSRLRRVSFCVDVEIAGGPRYRDEEDDEESKDRKKKDFKMKERAEGEALKRPEVILEENDEEDSKTKAKAIPGKEQPAKAQDEKAMTEEEKESAAKKRDKKQKSEAERKERKEKRRRRAEENGQVPVEVILDGENDDDAQTPTPNGTTSTSPPQTPQQPQPSSKQDRPTTDPVRIYRRCCQLRESPILKRITEQLSRPTCTLPQEPGVVQCLDLTGSRLQLADVVSLGDWLAVVPVKHLKLEDADLNDEGVRCVLAGLLAAKKPEPTRRKSTTPRHREGIPVKPHQERAGVIERLTLKNNPRLTRIGWKHINLFLYMCRSLKTIDVSMNHFPETLPPSAQVTPMKSSPSTPSTNGQELEAAEALYKCLSERLGGPKLEELIMSECGLTTPQIRKVVAAATAAGVTRLGLAGNHIDDNGLEPVLDYIRSGTCQAIDLGGNDLRNKLSLIADAIIVPTTMPCWGISIADCNLDPESLLPLFATLSTLPNFRFIDLSHNRDLCGENNNGLITLLRRYMSRLKTLKRIHLSDVDMTPQQAIALAEVWPEGESLAHLNLLGNPRLTALANAKTETEREEACAVYASLMASVKVSQTLICVDVDVPAPENSEVVKALAKQIVAYSLRNMEQFAIAEATGNVPSTDKATSDLTGPHGGERSVKEITFPDVLLHLVGHVDGIAENHDHDPPAPDDDYIIGGTGVVKALQYVLGEKESDRIRRTSVPSGTASPRNGEQRPGSSAGFVDKGRAKKMSSDLLISARKIRDRLQPALVKEATAGDDLAYRRLLFLDQTLQSMIARFEEEYPETRLSPPSTNLATENKDPSTQTESEPSSSLLGSSMTTSNPANASDDEDDPTPRPRVDRHNSDVSLAARALSLEEGRLHRIGQQLRREVIDSPRSASPGGAFRAFRDSIGTESSSGSDAVWRSPEQSQAESARLKALAERVEGISGVQLKEMVEKEGWEGYLEKVGATYEDLRTLQEQDPEAWRKFKDAQEKANLNRGAV